MILHALDEESWLSTIWDALEDYREKSIPEGEVAYDQQWDDICSAMAWIREELNLPDEVEQENLTAQIEGS